MKRRTILANRVQGIGILALALFASSSGQAASIIDFSGQVQIVALHGSLLPGASENDSAVMVAIEHGDFVLTSDLALDSIASGLYSLSENLTPGVISAGTVVADVYLHSDPVHQGTRLVGALTFSSPILGVIALSTSLDRTDAVFSTPNVIYPHGDVFRGFELRQRGDSFEISADRHALAFWANTGENVDELRIVLAGSVSTLNVDADTSTPEPTSVLLAATGLGALLLRLRKNRRKAASTIA